MARADTSEIAENDFERVAQIVADAVASTPLTDIHTHLYAPPFGELLLRGIDDLLTYHYLSAEVLRVAPIAPATYWKLSKEKQADLVWDELFCKRSPLSEACRGVLTALHTIGLDTSSNDLEEHRAYFRDLRPEAHVDRVLEKANIESVVMTNDPFDDLERGVWEKSYEADPRFHAALRIDPLLNDWPAACDRLKRWRYDVEPNLSARTLGEIRRFLEDWLDRMSALYMAVSLPPDFAFPDDSPRGRIIEECILPLTHERKIPFALMIGVTRQVNPALGLAGDGLAKAEMPPLHHLCAHYPDNKFLVTMLARENQHELCVAARKFPNLMIFGCWWFLNNPSTIDEMTRMRLELLGLSFIPQHSDARVLDQVLYKWDHSRKILARVLTDKYRDLLATGYTLTETAIQNDVRRLLGDNFREFLNR